MTDLKIYGEHDERTVEQMWRCMGVGSGCGNMAARVNLKYEDVRERVPVIANDIAKEVSFGLGSTNPKPIDHEIFDSPLWEDAGVGHLNQMARAQLGTVGSGNHYV